MDNLVNKKAVLSHGEPRDAAQSSIRIEFYKSINERLCTLNTATLSTRTHHSGGKASTKYPWIMFRGHSRSRILGSL